MEENLEERAEGGEKIYIYIYKIMLIIIINIKSIEGDDFFRYSVDFDANSFYLPI
jgi:hypothetical protein